MQLLACGFEHLSAYMFMSLCFNDWSSCAAVSQENLHLLKTAHLTASHIQGTFQSRGQICELFLFYFWINLIFSSHKKDKKNYQKAKVSMITIQVVKRLVEELHFMPFND